MDNRLKDRIAVITGGSSGIGRATALRFANSGARIVVADLAPAGTAREIKKIYGNDRATFVKCDVTKESEIENLVKEAAKWGGRVDIICNFAGKCPTKFCNQRLTDTALQGSPPRPVKA